ncbi:MAG: response regulator transcription factor [Lachnospiraceae bacterium]|nr:response regulator transcription factor [Lachnospiraceae bacterium]
MSAKILIVEDNQDINDMIREALVKEGYSCIQAFSGTEGRLLAEHDEFNLAILDLMLPGMTGEELLGIIKEKQAIPVIILSAKDSLDSKVGLLSSGADDYMTKPFELKELLVRVQVQLRKTGNAKEADTLSYKDMLLSRAEMKITVMGNELSLTRQEYKILELLLSNQKRVFSKQDIYDYAWEDYYIGEDKTINVHISNIRKKIKSYTDEEYIETVWGVGFKLY